LLLQDNNINVFAEAGTKIKYRSAEGPCPFTPLTIGLRYLQPGKVYTVKTTIPYPRNTVIELQEVPGYIFDTIYFCAERSQKKSDDELLSAYGPELAGDLKKADIFKRRLRTIKK
jgi:hypothetical protein